MANNQTNPPSDDQDFLDYDYGWRQGTFDKCNGRKMYDFMNVSEGSIWKDGYMDAWNSNERRI